MGVIIDGKAVSNKLRSEISKEVLELKRVNIIPTLAVIIVGNDPASKIYVRNKKNACESVGIKSIVYEFPEDVDENVLLQLINELNFDDSVHGILCQLPLPKKLSQEMIIKSISTKKDVDAFSEENVGKIMIGNYSFLPCTPAGIIELLKAYNINMSGKNAVVIGRSNIVGKPMAMMLLHENSTVTICHSKTVNLCDYTKKADIIVSAVGKANFLTGEMIKEGSVIIDVGMNRDENGKLCGDVVFDECYQKASYITPVPGGVGPMTITMLLKNTLIAAKKAKNLL